MCSKMGPKTYVGSTSDLVARKRHHKTNSDYCKSGILVEEYGWDNIIFTVLEECTVEKRKECEQYWIDFVPNTVNSNKAFATKEDQKERQKKQQKAWYEVNKETILKKTKARYESKKNKET